MRKYCKFSVFYNQKSCNIAIDLEYRLGIVELHQFIETILLYELSSSAMPNVAYTLSTGFVASLLRNSWSNARSGIRSLGQEHRFHAEADLETGRRSCSSRSWYLNTAGMPVEPMVLMLPDRGPLYQSIGNVAEEGAIRLV
jgi:hypothetical protein